MSMDKIKRQVVKLTATTGHCYSVQCVKLVSLEMIKRSLIFFPFSDLYFSSLASGGFIISATVALHEAVYLAFCLQSNAKMQDFCVFAVTFASLSILWFWKMG